jgi:hypothetical protein
MNGNPARFDRASESWDHAHLDHQRRNKKMSDTKMALATFTAAVVCGVIFIGFLSALQMLNECLPQ